MFEILKRKKSLETKQTELCLPGTFLIFDTSVQKLREKKRIEIFESQVVMHDRTSEMQFSVLIFRKLFQGRQNFRPSIHGQYQTDQDSNNYSDAKARTLSTLR